MCRSGLIEVERIGILHQKFAAAHQTETGTYLVTEFPLDVIEVEGQILVGMHIGPEYLGDHFLVSWPVEHVALVPIPDAQHLLAVSLITAALAPEICRL